MAKESAGAGGAARKAGDWRVDVAAMAGSLVHEIKNPLASIKGSMQVLVEETGIPEEDRIILSKVADEVKRIEALMKNLLDFARPPRPQLLPVDMNSVLDSTLALCFPRSSNGSKSSKTFTVKRDLDRDLPGTMADPVQMQQVLLNLLINASEAMPQGGEVLARTSANGAGREIEIEIADTGKGIAPEMKQKIFEPFFTTKHKGTGLGLAISKRLVEMHGGTLSVEGKETGGSCFRVLLPVVPADGEAGEGNRVQEGATPATGSVT